MAGIPKYWIKLFFTLLFGLVVLVFDIQAQDLRSDFLQRMKEANERITSIESDFIQERTISIMEEVLRSSGKFYYKKPDKMKWDQQMPTPYYFILNGDKVIRFDGNKRKEIPANSPQVVHFKDFIIGTVNGTLFENGQFKSTFVQSEAQVTVTLLPLQKAMKRRIAKVELIFDYADMKLLDITIFEVGGDKTAIHFSNQQFNSITDNTIFK